MASQADQFAAELVGAGSLADKEYARLITKTGMPRTYSLADLYRIAGEVPRLITGKYSSVGAAVVTPGDFPTGLDGWWKADILGLADGAAVNSWTDSSGVGNHAVPGTAPIYKTNIKNGLSVVRFDGATQQLNAPSDLSAIAQTIAGVVNITDFAAARTILGSTGSGGIQVRADQTTGTMSMNSQNVAAIGSSSSPFVAGAWTAFAARYDDAGNAYAFWLGNTSAGSGASATNLIALRTASIGARQNALAEYMFGDIAELAHWTVAMSDANIVSVLNGLKTKWAV